MLATSTTCRCSTSPVVVKVIFIFIFFIVVVVIVVVVNKRRNRSQQYRPPLKSLIVFQSIERLESVATYLSISASLRTAYSINNHEPGHQQQLHRDHRRIGLGHLHGQRRASSVDHRARCPPRPALSALAGAVVDQHFHAGEFVFMSITTNNNNNIVTKL